MPTQKKIETVQKLTEKLAKTKSVVLTDYKGLTHRQLEDLRKAVKKAGGDYIVVKNSLLKLSSGKDGRAQISKLTDHLSGATALLLGYEDVLSPLKEITRFFKKFQLPILKTGIFEDRMLTGEELLTVASLPSKDVLAGWLVWQLKSPLYRLHFALLANLQKLVLTLKAIEKTKTAN